MAFWLRPPAPTVLSPAKPLGLTDSRLMAFRLLLATSLVFHGSPYYGYAAVLELILLDDLVENATGEWTLFKHLALLFRTPTLALALTRTDKTIEGVVLSALCVVEAAETLVPVAVVTELVGLAGAGAALWLSDRAALDGRVVAAGFGVVVAVRLFTTAVLRLRKRAVQSHLPVVQEED